MSQWFIERQQIPTLKLSPYIAIHLQARYLLGTTVVFTDSPDNLLSNVRKQWLKAIRQLRVERASTADLALLKDIDTHLAQMARLRFATVARLRGEEADVLFACPGELSCIPLGCTTVYVTVPLGWCASLFNHLPANVVVVVYELT